MRIEPAIVIVKEVVETVVDNVVKLKCPSMVIKTAIEVVIDSTRSDMRIRLQNRDKIEFLYT